MRTVTRPPSTARRRAGVLVGLVAAVVLLAGCGGDDGDGGTTVADDAGSSPAASESSTPATPESSDPAAPPAEPEPPALPACAEVWGGATLPADYRGCLEGERTVRANEFPCSFGGRLVLYGEQYAMAGKKINQGTAPIARDPDWKQALGACTA